MMDTYNHGTEPICKSLGTKLDFMQYYPYIGIWLLLKDYEIMIEVKAHSTK